MKYNAANILEELSSAEKKAIVERVIRLRRDIYNMTQEQFSKTVGISQTYLSLLENGKREINTNAICQIATSLKVNLDWLIYGLGEPDANFTPEVPQSIVPVRIDKITAQSNFKKAFSLKESDMEFISWFANLPLKERSRYAKAFSAIAALHKN